jgi:hypothetical protein
MDQAQYHAQADVEAEAQAQTRAAHAEAEAQARAEVDVYVTPELLDMEVDRRHRVPVRRPRRGCWTRAFPHYAHVVADTRPLASQVRELMLCYCF